MVEARLIQARDDREAKPVEPDLPKTEGVDSPVRDSRVIKMFEIRVSIIFYFEDATCCALIPNNLCGCQVSLCRFVLIPYGHSLFKT